MDYLNDDNLEDLGLIKEVNTLKIIEKSQEIKEKKNKKLLTLFFIIMIIIAFIGQVLLIVLFNGVKLMKIGITLYVFISIALALILIDKGEKNLC